MIWILIFSKDSSYLKYCCNEYSDRFKFETSVEIFSGNSDESKGMHFWMLMKCRLNVTNGTLVRWYNLYHTTCMIQVRITDDVAWLENPNHFSKKIEEFKKVIKGRTPLNHFETFRIFESAEKAVWHLFIYSSLHESDSFKPLIREHIFNSFTLKYHFNSNELKVRLVQILIATGNDEKEYSLYYI